MPFKMQDLMFVNVKTMNKQCTWFHAIHPFYFSISDTHIEISNVLDDVLEKIEFMTMNVTHEKNKLIAYNAKECISLEVKDNKIYKQITTLPLETTKMYKISNEFCILGKNKNLYYKDITIEDVDDVFVKDDTIIVYKNKQLYRLKQELEILKFEENITLKNFYIINDKKFIVVDDTRIILTDGTLVLLDIDNSDADTNDVVIDQLGEYAIIANTMPGFTYVNTQTDTQYEIGKPECNLKTDLDDDLEMVAAENMCVCDNYIYILTAEKLYVYANRNEIPIDVIENVSIVDGQAAEASSPDTKVENASEVAPHSIKSMHEMESMLEKTSIEPVESIEQEDTAEPIADSKKDTKCDKQSDEKCEKEDSVKTKTRAARAGFDKADLASSFVETKDDLLPGANDLHIPEPEIDEKDKTEIVNEHLAKYNDLKRTIKQETEDLIKSFKQLNPCSYEHEEYEEIDSDYNTVLHNLYNRILDAKNGNLEKEKSYKLNLVEKYLSVLKDSNYNSTLDYFDKFIANIGNRSFYIPYESVNEIISGIERINIKSDKRVDYLSEFLGKMSVDEEAVNNETETSKHSDRVDEKKEETINLNDTLLSDDGNRDFGCDKYEKKDNEINASAHPFTSVFNYSTNQSKQPMIDGNSIEQRNEQVFGMSQTANNNPFLSSTTHTGLFNQSKMGNNPFTQNLLPNAGFQNSQSVFGTENNGQSINPFLNNPAPDNKKPGGSSALSKFANNHNRFI